MSLITMIFAVSFFLLFLFIGIVFMCGKGAACIAGYREAEPEERAGYDEKRLTRANGFLVISAAVLIPSFICLLDSGASMLWLIPIAISVLGMAFSFRLMTSDYVKKKTY